MFGLNYEHAPAEGPPIVALIDHVEEYTWVKSLIHTYNTVTCCKIKDMFKGTSTLGLESTPWRWEVLSPWLLLRPTLWSLFFTSLKAFLEKWHTHSGVRLDILEAQSDSAKSLPRWSATSLSLEQRRTFTNRSWFPVLWGDLDACITTVASLHSLTYNLHIHVYNIFQPGCCIPTGKGFLISERPRVSCQYEHVASQKEGGHGQLSHGSSACAPQATLQPHARHPETHRGGQAPPQHVRWAPLTVQLPRSFALIEIWVSVRTMYDVKRAVGTNWGL